MLAEFDRSIHCFFTFRFHVESATWIWRFSGACPFAIRSFKPEVGMTNKAFIIQKTMQLILLLTKCKGKENHLYLDPPSCLQLTGIPKQTFSVTVASMAQNYYDILGITRDATAEARGFLREKIIDN